jgi:hypothetical protein
MLRKKEYIIIGLTTLNAEFLRISVPGLGRLKQNIFLIVHNDNPGVRITGAMIRRLGWRGPLHIINADGGGTMQARLDILNAIPKLKIRSDWMMFADDNGMVIDADVPAVNENNYAVMQNMVFVKRRLLDLLKLMDDPKNYTVDDSNITIERPHIGIKGTLLRTDMMANLARLILPLTPALRGIDAASADAAMWSWLQIYARRANPNAGPIYMDKANYIAVAPDFSSRPSAPRDKDLQIYCALFEEQLARANT